VVGVEDVVVVGLGWQLGRRRPSTTTAIKACAAPL
jgi:hypothetical protein